MLRRRNAGMGALLAAHNAETAGKYAEAEKALKWIVDSDKYPELKPLASVRLAGVYLDEGKYDQGLTVLNAVKELKAKKFLFMTVWATSISPKAMLPLLVKLGRRLASCAYDQSAGGVIEIKLNSLPKE